MTLEEKYNELCSTPSDINEHLPTLKKYAEECKHITEMGTRGIVSTYALLMGKPKKLISYDICDIKINEVTSLSNQNEIEFQFICADTCNVTIEETDLLFIDTEHNYLQLKTELIKHGDKAKKYLIFHDTVSYGHRDSNAYGHYINLKTIDADDNTKQGLIPAIEEFVNNNPNWVVHKTFTNNNGLIVLKNNTSTSL